MFFERHSGGEKAILVHIDMDQDKDQENPTELHDLVASAGAQVVDIITGKRSFAHSKTYIGSGKVEEVATQVKAHQADIVIFNHTLSPGQERNLERALACRVLDRTGLILDIFAQRARTHEGKLQVELAQLNHMSTRLVRGWTHLERQKGGIGLRGPGETQLETDRRLLRVRITSLLKRLNKVRKQREQGRRSRRRADIPSISLVGYTNAGKSSLFNQLTKAKVYVADQLFATLDPTFRRLEIEDLGPTVLVDTVGFIRHLPHKLVDAFKATLQETEEASLLLHVIDASDPERDENIAQVDSVLTEIGATELPTLLVYNKIDQIKGTYPRIEYNTDGQPVKVWLSATTGQGCDLLREAIKQRLADKMFIQKICLSPQLGNMRAQLYAHKSVLSEEVDDKGNCWVDVRLPQKVFLRILSKLNIDSKKYIDDPNPIWD